MSKQAKTRVTHVPLESTNSKKENGERDLVYGFRSYHNTRANHSYFDMRRHRVVGGWRESRVRVDSCLFHVLVDEPVSF